MKIMPADFKRKINFLEEAQYKNTCPMLTGRLMMYQMFSFFEGHSMNLNDLLSVDLRKDNLKMFNQASEETLSAFGNDSDDGVLENLCERQVGKSTLMKNALTLNQSDIVLQKEPRSYQKLSAIVNGIFEHKQQNMLISQKERSRDRAAPVYFSKKSKNDK